MWAALVLWPWRGRQHEAMHASIAGGMLRVIPSVHHPPRRLARLLARGLARRRCAGAASEGPVALRWPAAVQPAACSREGRPAQSAISLRTLGKGGSSSLADPTHSSIAACRLAACMTLSVEAQAAEPIYLQPHANILVRGFPPSVDLGSFQKLVGVVWWCGVQLCVS